MFTWIVLCLSLTSAVALTNDITFKDGGYSGIVVAVDEQVPVERCRQILENLETAVASASRKLYTALDSRAFLRSVTVLLPDAWPNNCTNAPVTAHDRQDVHFLIDTTHPVHGDTAYTSQSAGCYRQGERVTVSHRLLEDSSQDAGHLLAAQWIKFRYGAFDERGFLGDPIYPACYATETSDNRVTGCSDQPIDDESVCTGGDLTLNVDAVSSLLTSPKASRLCDATAHDRYAPSKHNFVCARVASQQVVDAHPDFAGRGTAKEAVVLPPTTRFEYKRRSAARFVLVVEDAQTMNVRESWSYLRSAVRKFAVLDLPSDAALGVVLATDGSAISTGPLGTLGTSADRDLAGSRLPYAPGDTHAPTCLHCGLDMALDMLAERSKSQGPAVAVVVMVASGHAHSNKMAAATERAREAGVVVVTINYPEAGRHPSLDSIAVATGGMAFTVAEQRFNMDNSYLTTYFRLANTFLEIAQTYCPDQGVPIEVHRRELMDGPASGSFVLDSSVGAPARFAVFTHSAENPLVRSMSLVAPSGREFRTRSDGLLNMKMLTLSAELNETGTWTYKVDRLTGNPQPHFVQVLATPRSLHGANVIRAKAWSIEGTLFVRVTRGKNPVLDANVQATVSKMSTNGTTAIGTFRLYDSGNGDPDLTRNDGVYSRSPPLPPASYQIEIVVDDNSNTAYSYQGPAPSGPAPCCGSSVPTPPVQPTPTFVRHLPPITIAVTTSRMPSRVGDLRAEHDVEQLKTRLLFTAPEPISSRHEVRFARHLSEIVDSPLTAAIWPHGSPFPLPATSENTFTLDFTRNPSLLDTALFVCIASYHDEVGGSCSNWQRVLMPAPAPPPATATEGSDWTADFVPSQASAGIGWMELVLPVAGGVLLLVVCLAGYCVVCRKRRGKSTNGGPPAPLVVPSVISSPQFESEKRPIGGELDVPTPTLTPVRSAPTRQRTLSPYQSWTASQLLHEHERRSSPYGEVQFNAPGGGIYEEGGRYFVDAPPEAPPVPPLPYSLYSPGPIYGVSPAALSCHRNANLDGSVSSVSSGEKKKRNVTMV